jgi:hypothetical protein
MVIDPSAKPFLTLYLRLNIALGLGAGAWKVGTRVKLLECTIMSCGGRGELVVVNGKFWRL